MCRKWVSLLALSFGVFMMTTQALGDVCGYSYLTQWGSFGTGNGQFNVPFGVAVDSFGNVYVADADNSRIQKFTSGGTYLTQWGSFGTGNGQFNIRTA
jgi:DNA-binding beta-propeller fold protein YncE